MLNDLSEEEQQRLLKAMDSIERLLHKGLKYSEPFVLRPHEPGDMGWVAHRHGVLYSQEYGWDEHFEALVAQIVSDFITNYKPERERCWIAEMNGEIVGSVFCVQASETRCQAATAARRTQRARPGAGQSARRRVHPLCAAAWLPEDDPLDQQRSGSPPATSTSKRASPLSTRKPITATGMIWSARPGNWTWYQPFMVSLGKEEDMSANTSGIQIRAANADDAPSIAAVLRAAFLEYEPLYYTWRLRRHHHQPTRFSSA